MTSKRTRTLLLGATLVLSTSGLLAWGHRTSLGSLLVTGKAITPLGKQAEVGSFPARLATSPDGRFVAVASCGSRSSVSIIDAATGARLSQLSLNRHLPDGELEAVGPGLAFAPGSHGAATLYVSRGPQDAVSVFEVDAQGRLRDTGRLLTDPAPHPAPKRRVLSHVAGVATGGAYAYVADNEQHTLSVLDTRSGGLRGRVRVPGFPKAVALLAARHEGARDKVYVSSERDGVVAVVDASRPTLPRLERSIAVGAQPVALLLDRDGRLLYVANAGSDTVSVIDTRTDRVVDTVLLRPDGARDLPGATPTGLALSPDERTLYVSLGDLNAVAVVELGQPASRAAAAHPAAVHPAASPARAPQAAASGDRAVVRGYLPVGWYPTDVAVAGGHLLVSCAKGVQAIHPNRDRTNHDARGGVKIHDLIEGTVSCFDLPRDLAASTAQVLANNRLQRLQVPPPALPPIRHVIYVIRENRTYDQVLGDVRRGNGDPQLAIFGREVTPNMHALTERFGLLDSFYCCAEVSADGWNWSLSGMAGEYVQRLVPVYYAARTHRYNFEGTNLDRAPDLLGERDVARAPGGYLWDLCARHGLSYRTYGLFVAAGGDWTCKGASDNQPLERALQGHCDPDYRRFDLTYPDSDAIARLGITLPQQTRSYGSHQAPGRVPEWRHDFADLVARDAVPALSIIRLPRDHTAATRPGYSSPRAMVADNDYALGQLVETVSHSKVWPSTAIFVLEDDAQSGHDHVDAHRSLCAVISPWARRGAVDHRFYNTDSVLRTIEALLGLPPMCHYDATASILDVFDTRMANLAPYTATMPAPSILAEVNQPTAYRAAESAAMDLSAPDRVPDALLNDIVWHAVKGADSSEPLARHGLRVDGDDDD